MDHKSAQFAATVYRWLGFISVTALVYLTTVGAAPPGLALPVAAIWIVSYFYRFTREPENIIDATTAVAWLGIFIAILTAFIFIEASNDRTFITNLRGICEDIPDAELIENDFCDRLNGTIDEYLRGNETET